MDFGKQIEELKKQIEKLEKAQKEKSDTPFENKFLRVYKKHQKGEPYNYSIVSRVHTYENNSTGRHVASFNISQYGEDGARDLAVYFAETLSMVLEWDS